MKEYKIMESKVVRTVNKLGRIACFVTIGLLFVLFVISTILTFQNEAYPFVEGVRFLGLTCSIMMIGVCALLLCYFSMTHDMTAKVEALEKEIKMLKGEPVEEEPIATITVNEDKLLKKEPKSEEPTEAVKTEE